MFAEVTLKVVAEMIILRICLLAVLPGLPVNAVVVFEKRPGTTCGLKGGEAHLVWDYDDTQSTVIAIRWFNGTASGTPMGAYATESDTFAIYNGYDDTITFHNTSSAHFKSAVLTIKKLQDTDEGNYTTRFQAATNTDDVSTLEVAEVSDLLGWDICIDDTCNAISDPLILSASADVKVKFTKGGALTCDMDIGVAPSVGVSFKLVVPPGPGATAENALADADTLLTAGSLSIDLTFEKNGVVFHTDTIAAVSVISGSTTSTPTIPTIPTTTSPGTTGGPNTWNDLYVIPIVLGVCILVIIIVVVVVVRRRKKMETGRPHPQDRSSGVSVGASAAGMPPGGQPRPKSQPNPQSGAPSGDMAYKVGYVDPDAPALFHDDRYDSGFGNTGYAH